MLGLIGAIVGLIVLGCIIVYAVILTINWLRDKISEKLRKKNVKKVIVSELEEMIKECDNTMSMKDLDNLMKEGYTHMMAEVDSDGKVVGDVEIIKDENDTIDKDVDELLNRTNQGMVIVEG